MSVRQQLFAAKLNDPVGRGSLHPIIQSQSQDKSRVAAMSCFLCGTVCGELCFQPCSELDSAGFWQSSVASGAACEMIRSGLAASSPAGFASVARSTPRAAPKCSCDVNFVISCEAGLMYFPRLPFGFGPFFSKVFSSILIFLFLFKSASIQCRRSPFLMILVWCFFAFHQLRHFPPPSSLGALSQARVL